MIQSMILALVLLVACQTSPIKRALASEDPYQWLEQIKGVDVDSWVKAHNEKSTKVLMDNPTFKKNVDELRPLLTAKDRIPRPDMSYGMIRNFWQDADHVRGLWRETTPQDYEDREPRWTTILDIDDLNKKEGRSWVFEGASCLLPQKNLCLVALSDGGKDTAVVREFDVARKSFVSGGFNIPEAKSHYSWIDQDTIFVGSDFGPGSLTDSGYPKQVKVWKRGTPLAEAKLIFDGQQKDVSVSGYKAFRPDSQYMFIEESPSFFENKVSLYDKDGTLTPLPLPQTIATVGIFKNYLLFKLRKDWALNNINYVSGTVLSYELPPAGKKIDSSRVAEKISVLFRPSSRAVFEGLSTTKNFLLVSELVDVKSQVFRVSRQSQRWSFKRLALPLDGAASISDTSDYENTFYASYESFNVPPSLFIGNAEHPTQPLKKVKELSPKFDATDIKIEQFWAKSSDQTEVPYFVVSKKSKPLNGQNPTLLYGYGGFEVSMTPFYSPTVGKAWLEKGGVYVLGNIRGGGEFGPNWHEAVRKSNRQKAYEDFFAITQDLFNRKITSPERLGIMGGSNGGLLMGVAFTQHPEFYKAVVCESALLDMIRYTKLPPGASWIDEYGDPDIPEEAAFISKYSPYQNIKPGVKYPRVFFHISTADDRVQPGHTRKVVARMEEFGNDVLVYENTEGGHGGAADIEQSVIKRGLEYTYLQTLLMP